MRIHFVAAHAARRNDGVLERRIIRNRKHPPFQHPDEAFDLPVRDLLDITFRMDVQLLRQRHDQRFRHQLAQQLGKELRRLHLRDLSPDPLAQHLVGERRLQIQRQLHAASVDQRIDRIAAHAQRHGTVYAPFRKAQFAELFAHRFAVDVQRRTHVAQQHSIHIFRLRVRRYERRQRRTHRHDRMPQIGGERIAVARRSRCRIGDAARADDHLRALLLAHEAAPVEVTHPEDAAADRHDLRNARIVFDLHAVLHAKLQQRIGNVPSFAALGENAVPALDVEFHPHAFEEPDRRPIVELRESRGEKRGVGSHVRRKILRRTGIGYIAPSFAGDADLPARLFHFFEQQDPPSVAGGGSGGHHTCGSGTHDDHVVGLAASSCFGLFHTVAKVRNNGQSAMRQHGKNIVRHTDTSARCFGFGFDCPPAFGHARSNSSGSIMQSRSPSQATGSRSFQTTQRT